MASTTPPTDTAGAIVNGRACGFDGVSAQASALDWLRELGLTGAKEGCAEGECGACSVLVARPAGDHDDAGTQWTAINACLIPAASLDGQEVVTAEGLGTTAAMHPVQYEMAVRGGSQCGYCTPGFVCSMAAEYYRPGRAGANEAEAVDDGHECGPNGFDLHALSGNLCRCTGYRPIRDAAYALVGVSTDWGVEVNMRGVRAPFVIGIDRVAELRTFEVGEHAVELGAALTLSEIEARLDGRIPLLAQMFPQFASRLIRNGATIGGNLGTGSPIGDAPPALLALEAVVVLASSSGERSVPLADYFTGYRASVKRADELIRAVRIPVPLSPVTAFHKIAKRRFDDISSVAVGFALTLDEGIVTKARIGVGGVAATPIRARDTEAALEGRPFTRDVAREAAGVMRREGTPMSDHRASASYRAAMLGTALLKLHAQHGTASTEEVPA